MSYDKIVFKNKSLSNIFSEIYDNSKKKDKEITSLILELRSMIDSVESAVEVLPLIKEYFEIGVKNDEHLLKLASIVQRLENSSTSSEDSFDPSEIEALLQEVENTEKKLEDKKELIEDGLQS